jgi:hypothetical protein
LRASSAPDHELAQLATTCATGQVLDSARRHRIERSAGLSRTGIEEADRSSPFADRVALIATRR